MDSELKFRQEASARVEKRMLEMLMGFSPADELKLSEARSIAMFARTIAFDEFSPTKSPA